MAVQAMAVMSRRTRRGEDNRRGNTLEGGPDTFASGEGWPGVGRPGWAARIVAVIVHEFAAALLALSDTIE
jgi:hypothetical protein